MHTRPDARCFVGVLAASVLLASPCGADEAAPGPSAPPGAAFARLDLKPQNVETLRLLTKTQPPTDPSRWKLIFHDNFADKLSPDWYDFGRPGTSIRNVSEALELRGDGQAAVMHRRDWPADMAIECRAKALSDRPCDMSVMLASRPDGGRLPWHGGLMLQFGGHWNTQTSLLVHNSPRCPADAKIAPGRWHHIRIERIGSGLFAAIDGKVVSQCTMSDDEVRRLVHRRIGFYVYQSAALFDDVKVFVPADKGLTFRELPQPTDEAVLAAARALVGLMAGPSAEQRDLSSAVVRGNFPLLAPHFRKLLDGGEIADEEVRAAVAALLKEDKLQRMDLPPMPVRPPVARIDPPAGFTPPAGIPVVKFANDRAITEWLHQCPAKGGRGAAVAAALGEAAAGDKARQLPADLKPLPGELVVRHTWPDWTDAVDLKKLGGNKPGLTSVFCAVLDVPGPRLVRACTGAVGMNAAARMWVAGQAVTHGQLVRLGRGLYPIVVEADHGRRGTWIPWNFARLAARFTEVTAEEVEDVYRWHLSQWKVTMDGARADDRELLGRIRFDPKTVRGTEGFFRVGRSVNGKWWFIDPDGRAFYHKGCTGLNAGGMGGRRAGLKPVPEPTVDRWVAYLKEWGFNAMGAWTTPEFFNKDMPFAETIETYYVQPWLTTKFPDVFNPQWQANVDAKCKEICTPLRSNKMCLGYFLDNERGFMELIGLDQEIVAKSPTYRYRGPLPADKIILPAEPRLNVRGMGLLQFCLSLEESQPAYKKAWEFVLSRHGGELPGVAKAWGIRIDAPHDIRTLTANEIILVSDGFRKDQYDWVQTWVEQYYRFCKETIHKYDPNHLILGTRWGGTPGPAVLAAEARWGDVVSRNCYHAEFFDFYDPLYQATRRPVLNGEFTLWSDSYLYVRDPIEPPGGYEPSQRQRIRARQAVDWACAHPGFLGYSKYRWHGGGDKLWAGHGPRMSIVTPLRRHNYRAALVAASWDRPPMRPEDHKPLHGQVFLTLQTAVAHVHNLPAAQPGAEPSQRIGYGWIRLGFVCRDGTFDKRVYGNGVWGEVTDCRTEGNRIRLAVKIKKVPTLLTWHDGNGEYTIDVVRDGTRFEGTFAGTWKDQKTSGRAAGYLFRPVPTVNY